MNLKTIDLEIELTSLGANTANWPLRNWLTTFPLVLVTLDPYTEESARILHTARRIMLHYEEANCRTCWLLTCDADGAQRFLGPWTKEQITFVDPGRDVVKELGLEYLPAFTLIRQDGTIAASTEGWHPSQWRTVAEAISHLTKWNRPIVGTESDPLPYRGTPAARI